MRVLLGKLTGLPATTCTASRQNPPRKLGKRRWAHSVTYVLVSSHSLFFLPCFCSRIVLRVSQVIVSLAMESEGATIDSAVLLAASPVAGGNVPPTTRVSLQVTGGSVVCVQLHVHDTCTRKSHNLPSGARSRDDRSRDDWIHSSSSDPCTSEPHRTQK